MGVRRQHPPRTGAAAATAAGKEMCGADSSSSRRSRKGTGAAAVAAAAGRDRLDPCGEGSCRRWLLISAVTATQSRPISGSFACEEGVEG